MTTFATPVTPASMLVTPASSVNTSAGVKRRRETQGTHEEKVCERIFSHAKLDQAIGFSHGKLDKTIGGIRAPVDVINAVTHVFERKWVKRDSDLNRFLAMCSCLPQGFGAMSNVIPSLNGWRQRVEVLLHNMVRAEGQEQQLADEMSESLEWHTGTMKIPSRSAWAMALDKQ